MILVLGGGRSFKGAALYYLHDKRQDGEAERLTADRVAWTAVLNLPTEDPDRAWRMMAHTAMAGEALKKATGQSLAGRKVTKPVSTLVVSWKDEDKPTREEQQDAARSLLKTLGLDDRQALIVAHNDTDHPHLHILINRISPDTGIAAPLSKSKEKLQAWARAYQKERGQTHCPKREEKAAARERGEAVEPTPRVSRSAFEFNRAVSNDNAAPAFTRSEQKQQDAALYKASRDMHERHRKQWEELKRLYQSAKASVYERAGERQRTRAEEIKADFKPHWADLFKRQREDRRAFDRREDSAIGTLINIFGAARSAGQSGAAGLSVLAMLVLVFSKDARVAVLEKEQERDRKDLARMVSSAVGQGREDVRSSAKDDAARLLTGYLDQCATLRAAQAQERAAMKLAWAKRNAERKAAFAALRDRADKWRRLEEFGRKTRQQGQGMAPGRYRGREMRRE